MIAATPQPSLTVTLLPSGETGGELLDIARSWAADGLLKRALWQLADDVSESPLGTMTARAHLLDARNSSEHDPLVVLARSRVDLVTVVLLQVPQATTAIDEEQLEAARILAASLRDACPAALPDAQRTPIQLLRLNLLAAPTGLAGLDPARCLFPTFDANLVATPEDRRAADQMDMFVRPEANLMGWALAHAVTLGGGWTGMPEGPWRYLTRHMGYGDSGQEVLIRPFRAFTRMVDSAPTARRVLARAMDDLRVNRLPPEAHRNLQPLPDPAPIIDDILKTCDEVDGGRLQYRTPLPLPDPDKVKTPISQSLRHFLRFSRRELAAVPGHLVRRSSARLSRRATRVLSGSRGHQIVTVRGETNDLTGLVTDFERQAQEAERLLRLSDAAPPPATPALWRLLRETVFGLLDGSQIPAPFSKPMHGDMRAVVPHPSALVRPPGDVVPEQPGPGPHASPDSGEDFDESLLGRLALTLRQRSEAAEADAERFRSEAVTIPSVDWDEPLRARNQFVNRIAGLFMLTVIAALVLWRFGGLIPVSRWIPWVVLGVVWAGVLLLLLTSYYRRISRFIKDMNTLLHQQRDAERRCRDSRDAKLRLQGLHEQLQIWTEILGYALHDPWRPDPAWHRGRPSEELAASLPACVDVAVPDPSDTAGTRRLQQVAAATMVGLGWRAAAYQRLAALALADWYTADGEAPLGLLDEDAPSAPNGTRDVLLTMLRSGDLQRAAAEQVLSEKAAVLYRERDRLESHGLQPVTGEYAAEDTRLLERDGDLHVLRPGWGDFLAGTLAGATQFGGAVWSPAGQYETEQRSDVTTLRFAPRGVAAAEHETAPADRNRGVDLVVRCDFGPAADRRAIALFSDRSEDTVPSPVEEGLAVDAPHGRPALKEYT